MATAIHDPCLLVTLSEARGILGSDAIPETPGTSDSLVGNCAYAVSKTKLGVVTLSVTTESLKQVLSTFTTLAPAAGAGHDAECGASGLGAGSPSAFVGAIDSDHQLLILSPSCAIAVKVAEVAYSKLG